MKLRHLTLLLCVSLSLTGCSALLERNYATVEPHSSKFWESEAAGTLRAENYQDIVNDLLILIGQHTESATVRLYNYEDDVTVADALERAMAVRGKPVAVIADTVKGKGVSIFEGGVKWHGNRPNEEEYRTAFGELDQRIRELEES